jgi:hypothetical protein
MRQAPDSGDIAGKFENLLVVDVVEHWLSGFPLARGSSDCVRLREPYIGAAA